jgi:acyl-coenzyme A thioesterase PaaI-like protein
VASSETAAELAGAIRRLMDAAVVSAQDDAVVAGVISAIDGITETLAASRRTAMPWPLPTEGDIGHGSFSPLSGAANPLAPPMSLRAEPDGTIVAGAVMRPIYEGPPGALHGGWVAALLDHTLGHANAAGRQAGRTAELTIRYLSPTPHSVPLVIRAKADSVDGRRRWCSGQIMAGDRTTATATGLFIVPAAQWQRRGALAD